MAAASCTETAMRVLLVISFSLLPFCSRSSERSSHCSPTCAPLNAPENFSAAPWAPKLAPAFPPKYKDPAGSPAGSPGHTEVSHSISPTSVLPRQDNCERISCSDPLTRTPIGSPCGCVFPLKVVIDLGIAPILLFPQMAELEIEVAAGTHLKQSQVRIMGADASVHGQDKTTVIIYLVPLGEKFDKMTSLLIYRWFWEKKVPINSSIFGDYEAVSVHYPELPSFPPSIPYGTFAGSYEFPLSANVSTARNQKTDTRVILLVALSAFLLISLCFGAVLMILNLKKLGLQLATSRSVVVPSMTKASGTLSMMPSNATTSTFPSVSIMATYLPTVKIFALAELEKATNGFCFGRILGEGGFGCVYHGILEDESEFAIKMLRRNEQNGDREFIGEVQILSRLHHRNLVKLIGMCVEEDNHGLVYELVRNGSVESHLHGTHRDRGPLKWDARMKIAIGAARALAYLHEDSDPCIIHRDFKASNILLEEDFTPKVSDFGLAREARDRSHHISTQVMGTFGYVAPEYAMTGHLLVKSDVYSYGVVLLELLTGRKPVYITPANEPENLVNWARPLLTNADGLHQLIDPSLRGICNFDDFAKVAAVASMCVHGEAPQRPFMGEVVQALKLVYDDMCDSHDEASHSHEGSPPSQHRDADGDFGMESSWWSEGSPCPNYGDDYSIATAEYAPGQIVETRRPHSTSSLGRWAGSMRSNRSGPFRWKRKKMSGLNRLRGSMSEHGLTRHQFHMNV
ncbi:Receptor-like serine/threonine-protein kinase ALE2 [Platanthera guangdongensis]|uniref:Receptor-like serine/threonine-protein kinase ALE2 n=1 Tax=Platanthera guangdongensis TaxID=2320717 RepID=A0ABR2LNT2_9ASPA